MGRLNIRSRSIFAVSTFILLVLIIFGCGGGGGGGSSTSSSTSTTSTTSTTGTVTGVQLYEFYSGTQSPVATAPTGSSLALEVGDQIQFSFIGENSSKQSQTVVGSLSTNAPSSIATLNGNILVVTGASGSTAYSVTGSYAGKTYTVSFQSSPAEAKVTGVVVDTNGQSVNGAVITLYNSSGTLLAKTATGASGRFEASVPASATRFEVNVSALNAYFNEYSYDGLNYAASVTACYSSLPSLTTGTTTSLPNDVTVYVYDSSNPPPAPNGCG